MKLHILSPSQLQVWETGQFIIRYISDFNSLGLSPDQDPVFLALHNSLLEQSSTFNLALAQIHAKAESVKLLELDIWRDKMLTLVRRALLLFEYSKEADEQEAYSRVKIIIDNYKDLERMNFEAESLGIDNLVADLRSARNLPFVQIVNMVPYINKLAEANADFKTTFNTRSSKNISTTVYDTQALKKKFLATYKDLAEYVLVMAQRTNTPSYYIDILSAINNGREYYSNILARRKGSVSEAATSKPASVQFVISDPEASGEESHK